MSYFAVLAVLFLNFHLLYSYHIDNHIILLGSTGDLARKYLWQGFFNLYSKYTYRSQTFHFYACGRSPYYSAEEKLFQILDKNIVCEDEKCSERKTKFVNLVTYHQVASEKDFENLGELLKKSQRDRYKNNLLETNEIKVIAYLSIPPEFYSSVAENIHKYCRPQYPEKDHLMLEKPELSMRIVLEKPFGYDSNTAIQLQERLTKYYTESEIFRIDHYLGKSIVRDILLFRHLNRDIEKLFNNKYVDRIEVVLKETVDCKGRLNYYNKNGVIRDIFQNHLMEVLLLLVSPSLHVNFNFRKHDLVKYVKTVTPSSVLMGQYKQYLNQSNDEMPEFKMADFVPTFAAAALSIDFPIWRGVPMILVSGKNLNERTSYARVIFKKEIFCMTNCTKVDPNPQIIFHIGHGSLSYPMILVSKHFHNVRFPPGYNIEHGLQVNHPIYDRDFSEFISAVHTKDVDAYTTLIEDILLGKSKSFINGRHLLQSWRVWEDILKYSEFTKPRLYERGDKGNVLDFKMIRFKLQYVDDDEQDPTLIPFPDFSPASFLGQRLVTMDTDQLYQKLVKDIFYRMVHSRVFHIAFSGGKSPNRLFEILTENLVDSLNHVHIWQVDERCVSHDSEDSNFHQLWERFLSNERISIPYDNIHPMPVSKLGRYCEASDNGAKSYEESIKYYMPDYQFDYIVLGLGDDGHTASIFPGNSMLHSKDLVQITQKSINERRMTLTFPLINNAKAISVLVTGEAKREILDKLEKSKHDSDLPILQVNPAHDQMTWYIDSDALPKN